MKNGKKKRISFSELNRIKKESGIYQILNIKLGRSYIGSSINLKSRLKEHYWSLEGNRHSNKDLQIDWNIFGETLFIINILETLNEWRLDDKERLWIIQFPYVYNSKDILEQKMRESKDYFEFVENLVSKIKTEKIWNSLLNKVI